MSSTCRRSSLRPLILFLLLAGCAAAGKADGWTNASPSARVAADHTLLLGSLPEPARAADHTNDVVRERATSAPHGALPARGLRHLAADVAKSNGGGIAGVMERFPPGR
jgi:hypothetical protein